MMSERIIFDAKELPSPLRGLWDDLNQVKLLTIKSELDQGSGAVVTCGAPLMRLPEIERDSQFTAFGEMFGDVQIRGSTGNAIWKVQVRNGGTQPRSFSERSDTAPFHTDASYYPEPMKYLVFLVITPAKRGGESLVLNLKEALVDFEQVQGGKEAISIMCNEVFPFSMSPTFHDPTSSKPLPLEYSPILVNRDEIRFQIKAIRSGFDRRPDLATGKKRKAVELFGRFLNSRLQHRGRKLKSGQIMILNNRRVLHSRKSFDDPNRLLLRLSIAERQCQPC